MDEIEKSCFRNAEFINIEDAVPLILGLKPSDFEVENRQGTAGWEIFYLYQGVPSTDEERQFRRLEKLLSDACNRGEIELYSHQTIVVDSLIEWLDKRGITPDIWKDRSKAQPAEDDKTGRVPPYLDKNNPNFSSELEIVIKAWEAVNNGYGSNSRTFRQRACEWLEENYNIGRKKREVLDWGNSNLNEDAKRMLAIISPDDRKKR